MAILGDLEIRVMGVLWSAPAPSSVREVHTQLSAERDLAYTTVMTVLDRLAKKGVVGRVREGRQWLYSPSQSREDLIAGEVIELLEGEAQDRLAAFREIVSRLPAADRRMLADLLHAELLQAERRATQVPSVG